MSKRDVSLVHEANFDTSAPVVASFRNGRPPASTADKLTFEVYENPAKKQRIVLANSEKIAYQGANFSYHASSNDFSKYVVGVYSKNTREIKLCNIEQLYVMQQTVKGIHENTDEGRGEDRSYMERRRDLVEVFGSKKSKRIVKSREENVVNLENVSGVSTVTKTLKSKIDDAAQRIRDEKAKDASYSSESAALASTRNAILPPCNRDAETPEKVYLLRKFLSPEILGALKMKAEELIEGVRSSSMAEYISTNQLSGLVTRVLLTLSPPYDIQKISYVIYYSYLLAFFKLHFPIRKSASALSESLSIPLVVVRHMLALYTEPTQAMNGYTSYTQSKTLKDKLTLYMLVMALNISGFSLDIAEVASDLKKSTLALSTYCRQLGCTVEKVKAEETVYGADALSVKKSASTRAILTLPLRFPLPKKGAAPRR